MRFVVITDNNIPSALSTVEGIEWVAVNNPTEALAVKNAAAWFDLRDEAYKADHSASEAPVFINSVTIPLSEVVGGGNIIRVNGWSGFLEKDTWEIVGEVNEKAENALKALGKKYIRVNDEPGLVSARILSMIINEAFFAEEEKVSSREEIDIAMKLGTNYPWGPFEWAEKIGLKNIYALLEKLSLTDPRYTPSTGLKNAATIKN